MLLLLYLEAKGDTLLWNYCFDLTFMLSLFTVCFISSGTISLWVYINTRNLCLSFLWLKINFVFVDGKNKYCSLLRTILLDCINTTRRSKELSVFSRKMRNRDVWLMIAFISYVLLMVLRSFLYSDAHSEISKVELKGKMMEGKTMEQWHVVSTFRTVHHTVFDSLVA